MKKLNFSIILVLVVATTLFAEYEPPACGYNSQEKATQVYSKAFD